MSEELSASGNTTNINREWGSLYNPSSHPDFEDEYFTNREQEQLGSNGNTGASTSTEQSGHQTTHNEKVEIRDAYNVLTSLLPKNPDDTDEEYATFIKSVYEKYPCQEEENLVQYQERMKRAYENNEILENIANSMIDSESSIGQALRDDLLNIDDMEKRDGRGRLDEARAKLLRREVTEKAISQQKTLNRQKAKQLEAETRARIEAEERARIEAEARARAKQEAFEHQINELTNVANEKEAKKAALESTLMTFDEALKKKQAEASSPLAAINADFSADREELAHDLAEQELDEEVAHSNYIKKIWKGTLFKKYYQKKYENEFLEGSRTIAYNDKKVTVDDIIETRSDSAIKRFVLGVTEDEAYIHIKAGEKRTEADARTTEMVKSAIEWYASVRIPEDGSAEELRTEFSNRIGRLKAEARDKNKPINEKLINNYFDVAKQARERVEHGIAIERVMEGFKVYNADVRDGVRSKVHRDNIDKIINKLEESRIGSIVSSPVLAAAVGSAWGLTQTGSRAILGPVIGIGISGALAGLKERNAITEERTRMMRDAAVNAYYDGTLTEKPRGAREKYEAKLGGTIYDMRPASELINGLNQAMTSGDRNSIMQAIAEARVRIDYSDSESKDLISYSSGDHVGDERLKLDIALIRAEKSLSDEDKSSLNLMKEAIQNQIDEDISKEDQNFRKVRADQARRQAGKTILLGTAFFFASQEIKGAIDPNTINLLEKSGLIKNSNPDATRETLLAGIFKQRGVSTQTISNVSGDDIDRIKSYRKAGFKQIKTKDPWYKTKKELVDIKPKKSPNRIKAIYDGWADNGTKAADGNELGIQVHKNAIVANMSGKSTMNGETFDYSRLANNGKIKGFITLADGSKFEVASQINSSGQMSWPIDAKGFVTTTTGESIKAIGKNGDEVFKYFEVALDNGADGKGFRHIMPFATEVGSGSFKGTIKQVVETSSRQPGAYDFVKEIRHELWWGGVTVPIASRTGIGGVTAPEPSPETPPSAPEEPASAPEAPTSATGVSGTVPGPISITGETTPVSTPTSDESTPNTEGPTQAAPVEAAPASGGAISAPDESISETNPEDQDVQSDRDTIRKFLKYIGEEGAGYLYSEEEPKDTDDETFTRWWGTLSPDKKDYVLKSIPVFAKEGSGIALGTWLQSKGLLSRGSLKEAIPIKSELS